MKKKIVPFMLCFILLASICMPTLAATQSELENEKTSIEEKKNAAKEEQKQVKEELSAQMQEISKLDASISEAEEQIKQLDNEISELTESISKEQEKLEQKQKEHEENQELMEERMVAMYESGETTFLDMLFSSKNIIDFISNYYMVSQITQCDKELLETIENEQEEIENTKNKLEDEKTKVDSAKTEKETKNNLLKSQKTEREQKASALSEEEKKLQSDIDYYNKQVDKIEAQIQEAIRKAQEQLNSSSNGNGLKFDGSFIWPCNNKVITSAVKIRWGRWHKGIDIGARYENVYAAASGYAYTLQNPGGYGLYIMIVHGDGYITLYGHLNAYKVSYGQYVTQGQVIAQSGNSGSSQGAHLHFEIRKASSLSNYFSSSFLNPVDYLPGGYTYAPGATTPS